MIKTIMLEVRSGRIAYALLSSDGVLGIGGKLFAIPWHALALDTDPIINASRYRYLLNRSVARRDLIKTTGQLWLIHNRQVSYTSTKVVRHIETQATARGGEWGIDTPANEAVSNESVPFGRF